MSLAKRLLAILSEDDKPRRDVGRLEVDVWRRINFDGRSFYYAKTAIPSANGLVKHGEETEEFPTVAGAMSALMDILKSRNITGKLTFLRSHDNLTQRGIDAWKQGQR